MENLKIGVLGAGSKRYKKAYREILKKVGCKEVYCWNRTKEKIEKPYNFEKNIGRIQDFCSFDFDIILCFLPDGQNFDFVSNIPLKNNQLILLETPISDPRWFDFTKFRIGVLEQWPYLPVELFKKKVYDLDVISLPHQIINDGRSFDYHAIAQMRSFCNDSLPKSVTGMTSRLHAPKYKDFRGKDQMSMEEWCYGLCNLSNNTNLVYMFSYDCKLSILKPLQMMRHCSVDGSIISGRSLEMENDYELFRMSYLKNDTPQSSKIERIPSSVDSSVTKKIVCQEAEVFWENEFAEFGLTDHESAIAYMLADAIKGKYRKPHDAFMDSLIIHGFKVSASKQQVVRFD